VQIGLKNCVEISDAGSVHDFAEQAGGQKGWDLSLSALCAEDSARTVRFLTGAVLACGGYVLSRRFDYGNTAAIEFEFVRATCVEMYSVLIAAGLELTAQSHLTMAALCQCTRETLDATAADPVRVELTIRKTGASSHCEPGGSAAPPQVA
jgi:alkylation response protein AidB-like acyl-CoA dehydrogenase